MSSQPYRYPQQIPYLKPGIAAPAPAMSSQRFCLRWNNHQSNLLSVFDQLLHDESFVDVTLAVEGQLLKAHKMVLSACSPYFQALFINHPDKHPIVILKDVPYNDMRCLLDFMYRGEVSVDQDRLTAFLRVAESLRIKGLTEVNEEKCDTIASSLTQQNLQNLPNLQRLQQSKRFGNHLNMLGNALLQPKRKRGRPRKLSGCSNGPDDYDKDIVQGSPEMLEVKMGMDNFAGNNSDTSVGKNEGDLDEEKVKTEPEPVAGSSNDQSMYNNKLNEDFHPSDLLAQKLLTPKTELNENAESSNSDPSNQLSNTPESSRISTPDNFLNNNNNMTPSTSSTSLPNMSNLPQNLSNSMGAPSTGRQPSKRRVRRRATSQSQDPAEALTEMSVRGLNLFRYASINEGVYQCTECAKVDVQKTFKNKYSFQRHAFLYHEGHQRKVFPCPVCQKEFSRPDKMKNHMKTVHDCFMPKDVVFPPMGFFPTM
ncbi:protein tramtrack, alpha isoform-like isoform X3 [Diorhabda carinulata]|uniref:protein tramtrack, alpha isoform-like isoform X2 n=1 Tax=Diorhabda sublineata TaxID=1163346 RepID=UPI0024E19632|nr:protein tramtrack, alpha isoform-like isoform X2 [Diorhabda sublineata]XP_057664912.1 protein tramtrack, alpha isoform-like isoform X3 [Diorhabda carinulata]XP_057664913.1 protein tramtrack, alpha isoform-like isoform X3 [Diorhabda carinulata]